MSSKPLTSRDRTSLDDRIDVAAHTDLGSALERRGRGWLLWSFLLCPCHLPLSLAAIAAVLAGTSAGIVLRDHIWVAGALITAAWVVGTGYGFRLIRQAKRAGGACPTRRPKRRHRGSSA